MCPVCELLHGYHRAESLSGHGLEKSAIYCRYIDDIFMQVPDVRHLQQLKKAFEQNSVLSFTYEMESDGRLPFLDVTVTERNGGFHNAIYTNEMNIGMCLNANSDCSDRYKRSVVNAYVDQALSLTVLVGSRSTKNSVE